MNSEYFMSSLDSVKFEKTRRCNVKKIIEFDSGKKCLLVNVDIPVIGQDYNAAEDISTLILASRFDVEDISQIKKFPYFVYICRSLVPDIENCKKINKNDVEIMGWGELYRTRSDADRHRFD